MAHANRLLTPKVKTPEGREATIEAEVRRRVAKEAEKIRANAVPRRVWYGPDKLRMAYYAGQGKSGAEIARIMGGTTGPRVRAMLHVHDIPLLRAGGNDDATMMRWKREDRAALDAAALKRDRDPAELAALIVRKVLAGGDKAIDALVDEYDVIG